MSHRQGKKKLETTRELYSRVRELLNNFDNTDKEEIKEYLENLSWWFSYELYPERMGQ